MWLVTLLEYATGFIPRPMIIRPDEGGFRQIPKLWGGTWVTELKPHNWYWLIPWFMENEVCKTPTQPKDIRAQSAWTADGHNVTVGASVKYYVSDPMKALLDVHDYDESLQNTVLGVVCDYVGEHTLEVLKSSRRELTDLLLKMVREASKGWGLKIQDVRITDIGDAQNHRLLISGME
jgi:regulator of protease activity HflC (stomatin/prohibitin superfamily)